MKIRCCNILTCNQTKNIWFPVPNNCILFPCIAKICHLVVAYGEQLLAWYVVDQCTMPPLSCKWIYARHVATILIYYSPLRLRHLLDFIVLEWSYLFNIHTTKSNNSLQKAVLHFDLRYYFKITSHIWFAIVSPYLINLKILNRKKAFKEN